MDKDLAVKILEAIFLASRRKIKKTILIQFFYGFDLEELIALANKKFQDTGFFIYEDGETFELVTRPELYKYLINFFDFEENEIIQEILEVLAIIAYGGPISLREINKLRGKKSALVLKELLNNGFVKKEKNYYRLSYEFLKALGAHTEKDLPDYQDLHKEIQDKK